MRSNLGFELHALTARLDRSGDRILQAELGLSYRRFLALLMVGELGADTQRALADRLGVSEPSVSRMAGVLAEAGLLDVQADPAGGNRRRVALTAHGKQVLARCRDLLEGRLERLAERSGVPHQEYSRRTRELIAALDAAEMEAQR